MGIRIVRVIDGGCVLRPLLAGTSSRPPFKGGLSRLHTCPALPSEAEGSPLMRPAGFVWMQ